jgi:hypothetical protein
LFLVRQNKTVEEIDENSRLRTPLFFGLVNSSSSQNRTSDDIQQSLQVLVELTGESEKDVVLWR